MEVVSASMPSYMSVVYIEEPPIQKMVTA